MHAALTDGPLPESLLLSALGRLRVEGKDGFRPARLALIKLVLRRGGTNVSDKLDEVERRPAYVLGRLLRIYEEVQYAALGKLNSNVVDKFYGTFSAAPALLLGRLDANARNHLRRLRTGDDKQKRAFGRLDMHLAMVFATLKKDDIPARLSPQEQGLFALGYYHEKARSLERRAEARRLKAEQEQQKSQAPTTN